MSPEKVFLKDPLSSMSLIARSVLLLISLCISSAAHSAEELRLDSHLEPLRPMLGKTWKGTFTGGKPEKPVVDIMHWERALNGRAVRSLHSINDGNYGGETIFMWDEKKQKLGYHYFTTAGFMTTGTITVDGKKWTTQEVVTGSSGGVTEVRATSELLPDGSFHVKSEHLVKGEWKPGHEATYHEDTAAKVIFK